MMLRACRAAHSTLFTSQTFGATIRISTASRHFRSLTARLALPELPMSPICRECQNYLACGRSLLAMAEASFLVAEAPLPVQQTLLAWATSSPCLSTCLNVKSTDDRASKLADTKTKSAHTIVSTQGLHNARLNSHTRTASSRHATKPPRLV